MTLRAWRVWLSLGCAVVVLLGATLLILSFTYPVSWYNSGGSIYTASDGSIQWVEWSGGPGAAGAVAMGPADGLVFGRANTRITITASTLSAGTWRSVLWTWPLGFAAALGLPALWLWFQERKRKRIGGLCVHCGYDSRGLKVCPECGREVSGAEGASRSNG